MQNTDTLLCVIEAAKIQLLVFMDFKPASIYNILAYIIYNSSMKMSTSRRCKHINSCRLEEVSRIWLFGTEITKERILGEKKL